MTENEYVTFHEHIKHCKYCEEAFSICPEGRRLIIQALDGLAYSHVDNVGGPNNYDLLASVHRWLKNPANDALRARGDVRWHTVCAVEAALALNQDCTCWLCEIRESKG